MTSGVQTVLAMATTCAGCPVRSCPGVSKSVIGLGQFYTVFYNLCSLTVEDDAVLGNGDLIYYCGFSDCHL
jgi:hypothetical protein